MRFSDEDVALVLSAARDPEQALQEEQARKQLDAVLDAMDPDLRTVFVLFELEGMQGSDIAEALCIPTGASDLERSLLSAGTAERPHPGATTKTLAALAGGVSVLVAKGVATTAPLHVGQVGVAKASYGPLAAIVKVIASNWLVFTTIGAVAVGGGIAAQHSYAARAPAEPSVGATLSTIATPGPIPGGAASGWAVPPALRAAAAAGSGAASGLAVATTASRAPALGAAPNDPDPGSAFGRELPVPMRRHVVADPHAGAPPANVADDADGDVANQVESLDKVRRSLRENEAAAAIVALNDHQRRFRGGPFAQEVEVLRIEALQKSGDSQTACEQARRFVDIHAQSAHLKHVRSLLRNCPDR